MNSESENEKLVRDYAEKVISTGQVELPNQFVSPNYVDHNDPSDGITGLDALAEHILAVRSTYPHFRLVIERCITKDSFVIFVGKGIDTHRGDWLGLKPTNKEVEIPAINIDRVESGLIVEHWGCANTLEALISIGALDVSIST